MIVVTLDLAHSADSLPASDLQVHSHAVLSDQEIGSTYDH